MDPHAPATIALLTAVAAIAGTVDGIAGGGGLLTVPALLAAGLPPHVVLATNKGQSAFGSSASLARFARSPLLDRHRAYASLPAAAIAAAGGAALVLRVSPTALRVLVLIALVMAAVLVAARRDIDAPARTRGLGVAAAVAAALGFYDGFLGPGTGTFLIVAYAYLWGDRLSAASANAKAANWASNIGSLAVFAVGGAIDWRIALPMGVGQAIGGWLGAHLVLRRGHALVRLIAVCACLAMVARSVWALAR